MAMHGSSSRSCLVVLLTGLAFFSMPVLLVGADRQRVSVAVTRSLELLQQTAATYTDKRDCFSCHHQALPSMAIALAAGRGFDVDRSQVTWQSEFTASFFLEREEQLQKGSGVPGGAYTAAYAAMQLAADQADQPRASELLVKYLHQNRQQDGHWKIRTRRPPLEESDFTATALSLAALRLHDQGSEPGLLGQKLQQTIDWLAAHPASTTEDHVYRLLGLYWGSVDARRGVTTSWSRLLQARPVPMAPGVRKSFQETVSWLIAQQREDGGWSQLEGGSSDAYASGQVVTALLGSGAARSTEGAIRRGIEYLLKTQQEDGSWYVASRSKAFQEYFESGFPHGTDQFISVAASSWATMALLLSRPARASRTLRREEK